MTSTSNITTNIGSTASTTTTTSTNTGSINHNEVTTGILVDSTSTSILSNSSVTSNAVQVIASITDSTTPNDTIRMMPLVSPPSIAIATTTTTTLSLQVLNDDQQQQQQQQLQSQMYNINNTGNDTIRADNDTNMVEQKVEEENVTMTNVREQERLDDNNHIVNNDTSILPTYQSRIIRQRQRQQQQHQFSNSSSIRRRRISSSNNRQEQQHEHQQNTTNEQQSNFHSIHNTIQSHNYEVDENEVWRAYKTQIQFINRGQWWTTSKQRAFNRWIITFIIGISQAIIAIVCNFVSKLLSAYKFNIVYTILSSTIIISNSTNITSSTSSGNNNTTSFDNYYNNDKDDDTVSTPSDTTETSGLDYYGDTNTNISIIRQNNVWNTWYAYIVFVTIQLLYAIIASSFVWIEPLCGGSGIPEIKCFLNGINIPRIARIKTLVCRVLGTIFSVAAGLPLGMEGPMVHSGAVVAAGISQGKTKLCKLCDISFSKLNNEFRNDYEKRDFVVCGTAAGVTSAFGSPIGGVLFAFEETSSFFTTKLIWRAFFCAMTTLGTLFSIRNISTRWGQANIDKLFSLGEFNSFNSDNSNFSIWELSFFIIIGCLGGLIGAVFNAISEQLTIYRMKHIHISKFRRLLEVICISIVVSSLSFITPLLWNKCTPIPPTSITHNWSNEEKRLLNALVPFQCIPGKEYNEVASLSLTDADYAIKQLFHFREVGDDTNSTNYNDDSTTRTFSSGAILLFFIPYISMAVITYGSAVPSGLFVPSLLSGAAFGRLVAHLLHKLDHTNGTFADSGTYALIGSAAILGGMARMTISLTVILLEATGDMQYVLPLMATLMAARFTGNLFNDGIYDISIRLKNIPFLQPDVPSIAERYELLAGQVMASNCKCLYPIVNAGTVYDLLKSCSHSNFPIIIDTTAASSSSTNTTTDSSSCSIDTTGGTLYGTISRNILCTLLQRRAFGLTDAYDDDEYNNNYDNNNTSTNTNDDNTLEQPLVTTPNLGIRRISPLIQWDTFERVYPRYPTIDDITPIKESEYNKWIDLRPYINTAPYTINETASIQRTYRLFRTLGLRFLCVVNNTNQVVGIITRKDLLPESLSYSLLRNRNGTSGGTTDTGTDTTQYDTTHGNGTNTMDESIVYNVI